MKILHLISGGDKGGAKTHVFTLLNALKDDIDVNVICFMEGVFYKEIKHMNIKSMLLKQHYRNDLTIIKKLINHIRNSRYDIIHAHGARANFICMFLKPFIKIPIITSIHSDYRLDFTQNIYKKIVFTHLNTKSLKYFDYYIAVSENFKEMLCKRNFKRDLIYTVYNAIDFDAPIKFKTKSDFSKTINVEFKDKLIIGIIGRFDKVKGHEVFIKAAAKLIEKNDNLLFLLAGEGDEQANLVKLAKSLGIYKNLKFIGFINDIYSFINAIDINVLSSHSESFPYVLLEGARLSKPTLSTNVGGISDLIQHNITGLLCEPNNHIDMAEKLQILIDSSDMQKTLGENLFQYASSNFSKENLKNRHIEIYRDILKRHKENNKLFDVMLSGYYGFNNSGDDALLGAIIQSLREIKPDLSLVVLSKNSKETSKIHNVVSIKRYNLFKIISYLKKTKLFLNGGGSLIQDITSTNSLIYYTSLMSFAKKYNLKIMLYANGIGPIIKKSNEKIAINALNKCDVITLRDPESFKEMERLGIQTKDVSLSVDPAFIITPSVDAELSELLLKENICKDKKYFAVSVRNWKHNDVQFVSKLVTAITNIYTTKNLIPIFIPMQHPHDVTISKEISIRLDIPHVFLTKEYTVKEIMGIISTCDLVLGMRLHTLIYAVKLAVPVIGIIYDPKIKSFMDYIGQQYYIECSNICVDTLLELVDSVCNNSIEIKSFLRKKSIEFEQLSINDAKITIDLLNS